LTLSVEQKALAEERIKAAGFEDRIRVHLLDYREIPADFEKAFDAFVSIEMIEVSKLEVISLTSSDDNRFSMSAQSTMTLTSSWSTLLSSLKMPQPLSRLQRFQSRDTLVISGYFRKPLSDIRAH